MTMACSPYDKPPPPYSSHWEGGEFVLSPVSPLQPVSPAPPTPTPTSAHGDQEVASVMGLDMNYLELDWSETSLHVDAADDGLGADVSALVKHELRETIKKRRRSSGQPDYPSSADDTDKHTPELTAADEERRRRRRESNRRAARKLRIKKAEENKSLQQNFDILVLENKELREEIQRLRREKEEADDFLQTHLAACQLGDVTGYCNELPDLDRYCLDLV